MIVEPELGHDVRTSWHQFLGTFEALRPDLYRYCRHLTRSPWDAEDLVQDTLARAFVTLAQMQTPPPSPRAWLFRVASHLWIDRWRRSRREVLVEHVDENVDETANDAPADARATREAAGTLIGLLSPQERAAVVLKDALDLSLEETAETLGTTVGAIKTALRRGRGKLAETAAETPPQTTRPQVLDAFCDAFNAGDLDRLASLLLDTASVEVVGATTVYGPEAARETVLWGMLFGVKFMVDPASHGGIEARCFGGVVNRPPRVELRAHRGDWVLLHWYAHEDGDAVRAVTRVEADEAGTRVAHLANHFYDADLVADVAAELGAPSRSNGYRWWRPQEG